MTDAPLYIVARNCFGADFYLPLVEEVCAASSRWIMAGTGSLEGGVEIGKGRMGWIMPEAEQPEVVGEVFVPFLLSCLDAGCTRLGIDQFVEPDIEIQLTAYHNRGGYDRHVDDGSNRSDRGWSLKRRRLSFVYYFHAEPKPFTGGALVFPEHGVELAPRQDTMVCFLPHQPHAVYPVFTGSKAPESCRFTINGWISEREEQSVEDLA